MRVCSVTLTVAIAWAFGVIGSQALANGAGPDIPAGYRLLYSQDFEKEAAIADFEFTDPARWQLTQKGDNRVLECLGSSKYKPKVRSPGTIALLSDRLFADFVLEVDLLQTGREYGHRDLCVFLGFTDPSKFYYVHLASKADPNAHNIFIVNDAPRTTIAKKTTEGIDWGQEQWHKVRIVRKIADGTVEVFFDDMTEPIMVAEDKTFGSGYVGFGSFDDSGLIDNIRIWAPQAETKPSSFFEKKEGSAAK